MPLNTETTLPRRNTLGGYKDLSYHPKPVVDPTPEEYVQAGKVIATFAPREQVLELLQMLGILPHLARKEEPCSSGC